MKEHTKTQVTPQIQNALDRFDFSCTDAANAQRLVSWYGDQLRYVPLEKRFYLYDSTRWTPDLREGSMALAKETIGKMVAESVNVADTALQNRLLKWAKASLERKRLEAMLFLARSEEGIAAIPGDFDSQSHLFNLLNGTLDLCRMTLRRHSADDMLSNLAPVSYDENADTAFWEECLWKWTGGDEKKMRFLQLVAGLSVAGDTSEEIFVVLVGRGGSGKSTFLNALTAMSGDYARTAQFASFLRASSGRTMRDDIADLAGSRLVVASEAGANARLDAALVKTMTGGDTVRARKLYGHGFEYKPSFVLWLAANAMPSFDTSDTGIRRRIRVVEFDQTITPDPLIKKQLTNPTQHGAAILKWAIDGLKEYRRNGLGDDFAMQKMNWGLFG